MSHELTKLHLETARTLLEKEGPCTFLQLVDKLQERGVCPKLDRVSFMYKLRAAVKSGELNEKAFKKPPPLKGLSVAQKQAIVEIVSVADVVNELLSFKQIAERCVEKTNEGTIESVEISLRFLFYSLSDKGENYGF